MTSTLPLCMVPEYSSIDIAAEVQDLGSELRHDGCMKHRSWRGGGQYVVDI